MDKSSSKEPDFNVEINNFKNSIKSQAEDLVLNTFPRKTLELHNLLESSKFCLKNLEKIKHDVNIPIPEYPYIEPIQSTHVIDESCSSDSSPDSLVNGPGSIPSNKKRKYYALIEDDLQDGGKEKSSNVNKINKNNIVDGSRVLILPYGSVSCNKHIVELIDIVKPLIRQLVEDTNLLKMWVLFLIPRIEDGNNFGVSIQEDILGEIRTVEVEASAYFDQISRYFLARARIITKIAKYPHVDDFRRNVLEIDEKEFISLRLIVAELRNHYASVHDIVTKNLEKIKTPRPTNSTNMY